MTNQEIAQRAFFRVSRAQLGSDAPIAIPSDLFGAATALVDDAFDLMREMGSGRDPRAESRATAERAVIQFVATELRGGDGSTDPQFTVLVRAWSKVAAKNSDN